MGSGTPKTPKFTPKLGSGVLKPPTPPTQNQGRISGLKELPRIWGEKPKIWGQGTAQNQSETPNLGSGTPKIPKKRLKTTPKTLGGGKKKPKMGEKTPENSGKKNPEEIRASQNFGKSPRIWDFCHKCGDFSPKFHSPASAARTYSRMRRTRLCSILMALCWAIRCSATFWGKFRGFWGFWGGWGPQKHPQVPQEKKTDSKPPQNPP